MLYYSDSSILLAILLDENRKNDAIDLWNEASVRVSSILLKLETITVLRRTYEHNKNKLEANWIAKKLNELNEYFQEINFRVIDEDIEKIMILRKEVSKCKTLDAIHIATAIDFNQLIPNSNLCLCTFDKNMADIGKLLKFKIKINREEDYI